jgi:hypothetical protein
LQLLAAPFYGDFDPLGWHSCQDHLWTSQLTF